MCGLTGTILGEKKRTELQLNEIRMAVTDLLLLNQKRGRFAAGIAIIKKDGTHILFKRPVPAARLVSLPDYGWILSQIDNDTTAVLCHTRWPSKGAGAVSNPRNIQPIAAGNILGTHNGTIYNADNLFHTFALPHETEVDSEFIFRAADACPNDSIFANMLRPVQGSMSAVYLNLTAPKRIKVIKGNKPLSMAHAPKLKAMFYSSEEWPLNAAVPGKTNFIEIPRNTLTTFDTQRLTKITRKEICFRAQLTREIAS